MNSKKLFLLLTIIVLFSIAVVSLYYNFFIILKVESVPIFLNSSGNVVSFDTSNDVLNFASVPVGAAARKTITLTNTYGFPISVIIKVEGPISDFLEFENSLFLEFESSTAVDIIARPTREGNFEGTLFVYFKR
jgi:E3 ubiquitin-protein ligase DOA10